MSPQLIPITITIIIIIFIFFFCSAPSQSPVVQQEEEPSTTTDIHDLLPRYGLPKGLLPNNVISYSLSPNDSSFRIRLQSPCYVHLDRLVYYDTQITGKLSYGSVSDVSGIQAQELFLWLPVTGIKVDRDSGMLEFFVGSLSQKLPAKQFEDVPACSPGALTTTSLVAHI